MQQHILGLARKAKHGVADAECEYGISIDDRNMMELGAMQLKPPKLEFKNEESAEAKDRNGPGNFQFQPRQQFFKPASQS